ncbi:50S ribosomal protein L18 [Candidatus Parcubacteria bacterium]|nr:50S ribosomal protein L18 [Candidatus Parcubacteria bacterium]
MSRLSSKGSNIIRRQNRVRAVVRGDKERPRLSVNISNKHISAQIIDDSAHKTIAAASTSGQKQAKGTLSEKSALLGQEIAKKAKAKKVNRVAFDRGSKLYHGRIKALADAAREEGLKF